MSFYGALFATDEAWGRMRHLDATEFDQHGRPLNESAHQAVSVLHGTHAKRRTWRSRVLAIGLGALGIGGLLAAVALPLIDCLRRGLSLRFTSSSDLLRRSVGSFRYAPSDLCQRFPGHPGDEP